MINTHLRERLEDFLQDHDNNPCDEECIVAEARAWLDSLKALSPEEQDRESMLMAMAYRLYCRLKQDADREMERYQAAIAAFVTRNGGVLTVALDEIELLDGTVTAFVDVDEREITYRFIQQSGFRS